MGLSLSAVTDAAHVTGVEVVRHADVGKPALVGLDGGIPVNAGQVVPPVEGANCHSVVDWRQRPCEYDVGLRVPAS